MAIGASRTVAVQATLYLRIRALVRISCHVAHSSAWSHHVMGKVLVSLKDFLDVFACFLSRYSTVARKR